MNAFLTKVFSCFVADSQVDLVLSGIIALCMMINTSTVMKLIAHKLEIFLH